MVSKPGQSAHPRRVQNRRRRIYAVHRDRHAEGISGRDPIPRPRVAQKPGGTSTPAGHDPPKTLRAGQPLRLFVREERHRHQPGQWCEAPEGRHERGQNARHQRQSGAGALANPPTDTLKGHRDPELLATFLFHGSRFDKLLNLRPKGNAPTPGGASCENPRRARSPGR